VLVEQPDADRDGPQSAGVRQHRRPAGRDEQQRRHHETVHEGKPDHGHRGDDRVVVARRRAQAAAQGEDHGDHDGGAEEPHGCQPERRDGLEAPGHHGPVQPEGQDRARRHDVDRWAPDDRRLGEAIADRAGSKPWHMGPGTGVDAQSTGVP